MRPQGRPKMGYWLFLPPSGLSQDPGGQAGRPRAMAFVDMRMSQAGKA